MSKKEAEKNEVAVTATTALSTNVEAWGAEPESEDLLIPRILVMQKLSKFVDDGVAKEGDFVSSVDGQVLGNNEKPLEVVVFQTFKTWTVFHDGEFQTIEPITTANADLPYEEMANGVRVTRNKTYNFYVLPVTDEGASDVPFVMALSRSSSLTARKMLTLFARLRRMGKPSAAKVLKLSVKKEKNEKGSWFSVEFEVSRDTKPKELFEAKSWYDQIAAKSVSIHEDAPVRASSETLEEGVLPF